MSAKPHEHEKEGHNSFVSVAVATTDGYYPGEGYAKVPANQPIKVILDKAAKELHLVDTSGYIATVGGKEVNTSLSYLDNGLQGDITIDFRKVEGGGGNR